MERHEVPFGDGWLEWRPLCLAWNRERDTSGGEGIVVPPRFLERMG
eukprot:CAMPEP_0172636790 /NCGR_PEP_ID=MMETSP1068-20121228/205647_1 /TAXON_ID=35684 /ORGANISM="Pseudopedinella elastica, Strain CCMP716" /LENGTH=45 /DNA_ID= /DNA_START= /DNA_END= /DNA_ORIENTATION=